MYVLTATGVTGFADDWVEKYGIEHLCNCHLPAGAECWTFTEQDYEEMGRPDFSAIEPDGPPDFVTIGKPAWKDIHTELFDDYVKPVEGENAGQVE